MLKTVSSITNAIGALNFKGTWNAATNTPTIVSGVGVKGDYFVVSVAGSTTIDGISNWGIGDWIVYNGNIWQRVEGGADLNGVNLTVTNTTTLSGLTASTALALDATKNVVSVANTGTGNNVLATSPTLVTPVLGTPSSGTVTNLTGTASININGTVGATTPAAGSFTTLNTSGQVVFNDAGADVDFRVEGDTDANLLVVDASTDRVGIGTNAPATKLSVASADSEILRLISSNASNTGEVTLRTPGGAGNNTRGRVIGGFDAGGSNFGGFLAFNTTSSSNVNNEVMRLNEAGALILVGSTAQKATGTTWSNPSDERLKDNIRDYGKGIAELMQVRVREWEYNGKGGTVEGTKGMGVVADEVMVVLPDTVENYEAKLNADDEEVTAIKKFDATEITWLLVKTVQEQQALITTLTARVAALEAQ